MLSTGKRAKAILVYLGLFDWLNKVSCLPRLVRPLVCYVLFHLFLQWLAAVTIQSAWRGHVVRSRLKREAKEPWDPQRNSAATVIQVKTKFHVI